MECVEKIARQLPNRVSTMKLTTLIECSYCHKQKGETTNKEPGERIRQYEATPGESCCIGKSSPIYYCYLGFFRIASWQFL